MVILIICGLIISYTLYAYGKIIHPIFLNKIERLCDDEYRFIMKCIEKISTSRRADEIEDMIKDWYNRYDKKVDVDYFLMRFDMLTSKIIEKKYLISIS
jgi:hypothetical protein